MIGLEVLYFKVSLSFGDVSSLASFKKFFADSTSFALSFCLFGIFEYNPQSSIFKVLFKVQKGHLIQYSTKSHLPFKSKIFSAICICSSAVSYTHLTLPTKLEV